MADIITIDAGGKLFKTSKSTLELIPYFRSYIERWNIENTIFLDRDPKEFSNILSLARNPKYPFNSKYENALDFYGLSIETNIDKYWKNDDKYWKNDEKFETIDKLYYNPTSSNPSADISRLMFQNKSYKMSNKNDITDVNILATSINGENDKFRIPRSIDEITGVRIMIACETDETKLWDNFEFICASQILFRQNYELFEILEDISIPKKVKKYKLRARKHGIYIYDIVFAETFPISPNIGNMYINVKICENIKINDIKIICNGKYLNCDYQKKKYEFDGTQIFPMYNFMQCKNIVDTKFEISGFIIYTNNYERIKNINIYLDYGYTVAKSSSEYEIIEYMKSINMQPNKCIYFIPYYMENNYRSTRIDAFSYDNVKLQANIIACETKPYYCSQGNISVAYGG